jgi:uncharacterized protein (DUF433 family)
MVVAPINHVSVDERGIAYVSGTAIRVSDIVIDTYTWCHSPSEIQENYPRLTMSEIHSALAYYHDHKAEIDLEMDEDDREYERLRAAAPNRFTREELEARMRTPSSEQQ